MTLARNGSHPTHFWCAKWAAPWVFGGPALAVRANQRGRPVEAAAADHAHLVTGLGAAYPGETGAEGPE